jgi:hypothetical protein
MRRIRSGSIGLFVMLLDLLFTFSSGRQGLRRRSCFMLAVLPTRSTGGMDFLCGCHSRAPAIGIEVFGGVDREQLAKTTTAFLSCRRRTVGAELLRQPAPQHVKKLEAPASQASPVLGIRTDTESVSDRSFPPPLEQMQPECFQDDAGGVPAPWVEEVGKDAQGLAAAAAKVAADSEDDLFGRDKTEHLSQVGAVTDDPQRLAGRRSRLPAARTV